MLMVQSNAQPMKTTKLKGPPPVPPRPNQSVVAEALAKTRRAVAESKASFIKSRAHSRDPPVKAKTLDRASLPQPSQPKQNGLARVKSFIRDVISDRSSSSDERRSSGTNSRRSSSDSCSIPGPIPNKKSNESLNSKAVKSCKQMLVRSLSSSNKLDQDSKNKVVKSSSFVEKTLPLRKAPPPPLSPKPKLKLVNPLSLQRNSLEKSLPVQRHSLEKPFSVNKCFLQNKTPKKCPEPKQELKNSPELSPYSCPIDAKPPLVSEASEEGYATVEEAHNLTDDRLKNNLFTTDVKVDSPVEIDYMKQEEAVSNKNSLERKTSRVTELLISEILASRNNKHEVNTVIDKGKDSSKMANGIESPDCEHITKDMSNHEMLIYELQTMRSQSNVPEHTEKIDSSDSKETTESDKCESDDSEANYANSSEYSGHNDEQAYAYILDDDLKSRLRKQYKAISTMSLQGLPPLPKSLSGFAEAEPPILSSPGNPDHKPSTDLDSQLQYLKKEMASLRQLDLSLLSELWTLSEAMASWRRQIERAPRLRPAPPPPLPPHYLRT